MSHDSVSDQQRLAQIRERAERATAGPWNCLGQHLWAIRPEGRHISLLWSQNGGPVAIDRPHDAFFVAHARDDIPWLLEQLAAAQAEIAALRQQLAERPHLPYGQRVHEQPDFDQIAADAGCPPGVTPGGPYKTEMQSGRN